MNHIKCDLNGEYSSIWQPVFKMAAKLLSEYIWQNFCFSWYKVVIMKCVLVLLGTKKAESISVYHN